jgi:hypothetical protein
LGNGELDANVYAEVMQRVEYCLDYAAKIREKKKMMMIELKHAVDVIRAKSSSSNTLLCLS